MTKEQYETLFLEMHPNYFERDYVRAIPEDEPASEMILHLPDFDETCYEKDFNGYVWRKIPNKGSYEKSTDESVTFGYYDGDLEGLRAAVEKVVSHWTQFFHEKSRVYCGFVNGKVASFCLIEDFGEHLMDGRIQKIGGPGCVGTLPEYRDRGIGLTMVRDVTKILLEEGYDYSYIHYTYETNWYAKLGYQTFLSWSGKGFV